jgi:hypothetical protein
MRQQLWTFVALLLCAPAVAGVKPAGSAPFDARQSAALFVGVREFAFDQLTNVPYAIDDAVDLAYEFAVDHRPALVPPGRVVLALSSGEPVKPESRRRLADLLAAGATRRPAQSTEILQWLETQSKRTGRDGILIISFATHGVSYNNTEYLLTTTSRLGQPPTAAVTDGDIKDAVWRNNVARSLILIDACREHLTGDRRTGHADPRSAFVRIMTSLEGQVMISGAAAGGYAYDDDVRRNGVFTAAVIDGLQCGAAKDRHGFVTVETLHRYVSRRVLRWVRQNRDREAKKATLLVSEGETRKMPLSICVSRNAAASGPRPR